jgi:hypothetical protein
VVTADSRSRTEIILLNKNHMVCYKINELHFSLRYSVHLSYKFPIQNGLKQGDVEENQVVL